MYHAAPSYGSAFPPHVDWIMDMGASSHVTGDPGILIKSSLLAPNSLHIVVRNGAHLPVIAVGNAHLPPRPFYLNHILLSPNIVQNLISMRQFTRDNLCSIEFDPLGFSLKDLRTKVVILRCNNSGDLYCFSGSHIDTTPMVFTVSSSDIWHKRLGHPSASSLVYFPFDDRSKREGRKGIQFPRLIMIFV